MFKNERGLEIVEKNRYAWTSSFLRGILGNFNWVLERARVPIYDTSKIRVEAKTLNYTLTSVAACGFDQKLLP